MKPSWWNNPGWILLGCSLVLGALTVLVGTHNPPNTLAAAILQAVTLIFGVAGSWLLGMASAKDAAQEVIRPHARSAFRRTLNLYQGLGRQRLAIVEQLLRLAVLREADDRLVQYEHARAAMRVREAIAGEQGNTAGDARGDEGE